jgi:hypothetical protein
MSLFRRPLASAGVSWIFKNSNPRFEPDELCPVFCQNRDRVGRSKKTMHPCAANTGPLDKNFCLYYIVYMVRYEDEIFSLKELYEDIIDRKAISQYEKREKEGKTSFVSSDEILKMLNLR